MVREELNGNYKRKDNNNTLCSTPTRISRFLGKLIDHTIDNNVVELGGGAGSLTQYLPSGTLCFEKLLKRIIRGKQNAPQANWAPPTDCLTVSRYILFSCLFFAIFSLTSLTTLQLSFLFYCSVVL